MAIDWTKPIETVDGKPAVLVGGVEDHREVRVETVPTTDEPRVWTNNWLYDEDGTVGNDFLPDLRNVLEAA